jgi:hypothetical protein
MRAVIVTPHITETRMVKMASKGDSVEIVSICDRPSRQYLTVERSVKSVNIVCDGSKAMNIGKTITYPQIMYE